MVRKLLFIRLKIIAKVSSVLKSPLKMQNVRIIKKKKSISSTRIILNIQNIKE